MAGNTRFIRSYCKHSHFYFFDHDRRFGLLDASRSYSRASSTTFGCVFRSQIIQPSLPRHSFNSNWCDMGQLCACDFFSTYEDGVKYFWYNFAYLGLVFLGYDVHIRGKNSLRLPFRSLQSCGDWGHVGYLYFFNIASDHAANKVWRLWRNRIWHAMQLQLPWELSICFPSNGQQQVVDFNVHGHYLWHRFFQLLWNLNNKIRISLITLDCRSSENPVRLGVFCSTRTGRIQYLLATWIHHALSWLFDI